MVAVGDALVGAAISELFSLVKTAIKKHKDFPILILQIQSTLESLQPLMQDMEKLNRYLRRPTEEIQSLKRQVDEGIECVREISKSKKFKSTWSHHDKLVQLDRSLQRLFNILNAQSARNGMETLLCTKVIFVLVLLLLLITLGVLSFLFSSNGVIVLPAKGTLNYSKMVLQSEDKIDAKIVNSTKISKSVKMQQSFTFNDIHEVSSTPKSPTQEVTNADFRATPQNCTEYSDHFYDDNQEATPHIPIATSNDTLHLQKLVRDLTTTVDDLVEENSRLERKVSYLFESLNNYAAARGNFMTSFARMSSEAWSNVTLGTAVRTPKKVLVLGFQFSPMAFGLKVMECIKSVLLVNYAKRTVNRVLDNYHAKYIKTSSVDPLLHVCFGGMIFSYLVALPEEHRHLEHKQHAKEQGGH